jgi:hypothetical protein
VIAAIVFKFHQHDLTLMPASLPVGPGPSQARVVRTLKNGYWDRTEIIELGDGSQRVRKCTIGATAPGPWGLRSLRREISYLAALPEAARAAFPRVFCTWDRESKGSPEVGYEMAYDPGYKDAGELARAAILAQPEIDDFQDHLAGVVINLLHVSEQPDEPLSEHLATTVNEAFDKLQHDDELAPLLDSENILLNDRTSLGPRAAFEKIHRTTGVLKTLDAEPSVRLHGDFFLENILWRHTPVEGERPRLMLIDPVSVAGVCAGPPVFDLVKYESYAKGELLALRSAWVDVGGFGEAAGRSYSYRIRWEEPGLQPFLNRDWRSRFRRAFENKYGKIDRGMYRLIDGYFSAAMAVNTTGAQRRARLLKATAEFNSVLRVAASGSGEERVGVE